MDYNANKKTIRKPEMCVGRAVSRQVTFDQSAKYLYQSGHFGPTVEPKPSTDQAFFSL